MGPKLAADVARMIREGHARGERVALNGVEVPRGMLPECVVEALCAEAGVVVK